MIINKLIERQIEVNKKCGFKLDLNGLYLGYFAEVGELSSIIALYEGFKKPKPKDLEKFPNWKPDLLKEMSDEFADVLVYLLQLKILRDKDNWSHDDKHHTTYAIENLLLDIDDRAFRLFELKIKCLRESAEMYNIDLEKAYFAKTDTLIARFK